MSAFSILQPRDLTFGRGCASQAVPKTRGLGQRVCVVRGRSAPWCDDFIDQLRATDADVTVTVCTREPALEDVTAATALARAAECDVVVAVGGGSVIDLAKAVAALAPNEFEATDYITGGRTLDVSPLPFVAIPTTSGTGAEVTRNSVICLSDRAQKISLRDTRMIADVALVDPALTDNSPAGVTFGSGLDAVVQVIEPFLSNRANAYTDALCQQAIPLGLRALARLAECECPHARDDMALVSLFGGLALTNAGLGVVHGLAGVIGGRDPDAPHGLLCGRLLCAALEVNFQQRKAQGLDVQRHLQVLAWLETLAPAIPDDLSSVGDVLNGWGVPKLPVLDAFEEADRAEIVADALTSSSMRANATPLSAPDLHRIIQRSSTLQNRP